jgi:hypothetical protein
MFSGSSPKLQGVRGIMLWLLQALGFPKASSIFYVNDQQEIVALPPQGTQYFLQSGTNGLPYNPPSWQIVPKAAVGSDGAVQYANSGLLAGGDTFRFEDSDSSVRIAPSPSQTAYPALVGGVITRTTYNSGSYPVATTGAGEEDLLIDNIFDNTLDSEGKAAEAWYAGTWESKTGSSTQQIRVYMKDGSTDYLIYDTGAVTIAAGGTSGDQNSIYGGGYKNGWFLEVKVMNWNEGSQYISTVVNFRTEDLAATALIPPTKMFITPFVGVYGLSPRIRITGQSDSNEIILFQGKLSFTARGSQANPFV